MHIFIYLNWMILSYDSFPVDIALWVFNISNWSITIVNKEIAGHFS